MMATPFTSPVGRFVQGDFFEPQTKDQQGAPRVIKTGPNAGQPNPQYFAAIAIAKNDPEWPMFDALLKAEAAKNFAALFPQGPYGPCTHPKFSFKVVDGDGFDDNGKSNREKEGFAGCWVVRFTRTAAFGPPKVHPVGRHAPSDQIFDKMMVRRGYYVRVAGSISGNDNAQRPGLYLNLDLAELCGYGPEIVSGPDAAAAFGNRPAALPPGASAVPLGATAAGAPGAAPATGNPAGPPTYGSPTASHSSYGAPAAPPPPPPPPPASGPQMTPKAGGVALEQFLANGWTMPQLVQAGYVAG